MRMRPLLGKTGAEEPRVLQNFRPEPKEPTNIGKVRADLKEKHLTSQRFPGLTHCLPPRHAVALLVQSWNRLDHQTTIAGSPKLLYLSTSRNRILCPPSERDELWHASGHRPTGDAVRPKPTRRRRILHKKASPSHRLMAVATAGDMGKLWYHGTSQLLPLRGLL